MLDATLRIDASLRTCLFRTGSLNSVFSICVAQSSLPPSKPLTLSCQPAAFTQPCCHTRLPPTGFPSCCKYFNYLIGIGELGSVLIQKRDTVTAMVMILHKEECSIYNKQLDIYRFRNVMIIRTVLSSFCLQACRMMRQFLNSFFVFHLSFHFEACHFLDGYHSYFCEAKSGTYVYQRVPRSTKVRDPCDLMIAI